MCLTAIRKREGWWIRIEKVPWPEQAFGHSAEVLVKRQIAARMSTSMALARALKGGRS